jgi:hypothetical protein
VLNSGVLINADRAMSWAFNIPRGEWGRWHDLTPAMIRYLKFIRVVVFILIAVMLFSAQRKLLLFGWAWFWITLIPALPLVTHFMPYYLFLPVAGLSLVVGVVLTGLYDWTARWRQQILGGVVVVLLLGGVLVVTARSIRADIENNALLGGSSRLAWNTLNDLKTSHPNLPVGITLYFMDAHEPLAWHHDFGGLIRMAYPGGTFSTLYHTNGDRLFPDAGNVFVYEVRDGRLQDATSRYRSLPDIFMTLEDAGFGFGLSAREAVAGDRYTLAIDGLKNVAVRIAYTLNDGPIEFFTAYLNGDGKVTFDVSPKTDKGEYKFSFFKPVGSDHWFRSDATLTIR